MPKDDFEPGNYVSRTEWRSAQEANAETFGEIKRGIRDLNLAIGDVKERRMDWRPIGVLVSISSLVLGAFFSLVAWGFISSLDRMNARTQVLEDRSVAVLADRYSRDDAGIDHGSAAMERKRIEELIRGTAAGLDESLQREMRLLDGKTDADLRSLEARISALVLGLRETDAKVSDFQKTAHGVHTAHSEQIKFLLRGSAVPEN